MDLQSREMLAVGNIVFTALARAMLTVGNIIITAIARLTEGNIGFVQCHNEKNYIFSTLVMCMISKSIKMFWKNKHKFNLDLKSLIWKI